MKNSFLSYAIVLRIIVPILLVIALGAYYLAFLPTVNVYLNYKTNCGYEQSNASLSVSAGYTGSRVIEVNKLYARYAVDTLTWKNGLWNASSLLSLKYGSNIIAYPGVRKTHFRGQQAFIQRIAFSGQYLTLVKLLHEAENLKRFGVVSALSFAKKPRNSYTTLQVDFIGIHERKINNLK